MGWADMIWFVALVGGALYLLYHSLWKKKGHCPGCDADTCAPVHKRRAADFRKDPH